MRWLLGLAVLLVVPFAVTDSGRDTPLTVSGGWGEIVHDGCIGEDEMLTFGGDGSLAPGESVSYTTPTFCQFQSPRKARARAQYKGGLLQINLDGVLSGAPERTRTGGFRFVEACKIREVGRETPVVYTVTLTNVGDRTAMDIIFSGGDRHNFGVPC